MGIVNCNEFTIEFNVFQGKEMIKFIIILFLFCLRTKNVLREKNKKRKSQHYSLNKNKNFSFTKKKLFVLQKLKQKKTKKIKREKKIIINCGLCSHTFFLQLYKNYFCFLNNLYPTFISLNLQDNSSVLVDGSCQIPDPVYKLVGSIICFYIPLLVMLLTYMLTVRLLAKQQQHLGGTSNSSIWTPVWLTQPIGEFWKK